MPELHGDDLDDGLVYDIDDNVISDTEDYGDLEAPLTPEKDPKQKIKRNQEKQQQHQPKKRKAEETKKDSVNKKKKLSEKVCGIINSHRLIILAEC